MRSAGPTSLLSAPRRRAHGLVLVVAMGTALASLSGINAVRWVEAAEAAVALRVDSLDGARVERGTAFTGQRPRQWRSGRLAGVGADTWAVVTSAGAVGVTKPVLGRGREPFHLGLHEAHRQARERRQAVATGTARLLRSAALAVSGGDAGDRPRLVTQSLRGPPARA
ncbi:hypothetical protein [Comamonas sp. JC664]|uniref:hypothetical protein n=1 Tax=Comamonas sp. JC664 TaxID=2801917 RepID=UPI0017487AF6|nr:hypothetical protein [Comamonas sp. JC664]MBL0699127.1 hypothetical protein [Comamonas sp. JC664]GHG80630.1 hypothetical protein GCM10012319_33740 [Comamonas sp. KCTC 72670]